VITPAASPPRIARHHRQLPLPFLYEPVREWITGMGVAVSGTLHVS